MDFNFAELLEKSNQNLSNFLTTEVEVGKTFARMARYYREHGNAERFEISKQNALAAFEAIDRFRERLPHDLRIKIYAVRDELAQIVSTL
jgi:hypothetical protein